MRFSKASLRALTILLLAVPFAARGSQLELLTKVPPRRAPDTASGGSGSPALSADGRYLAFVSTASNLSPGQVDDNWTGDVFLYDRIAGTVTLLSHTAGSAVTTGDRESSAPTISADGRWVAFVSTSTNLVDGQVSAGAPNVFLYDRIKETVTLVSHSRRSPRLAKGADRPVLSADGRYIAFESYARDLTSTLLGGGRLNVFLYDRTLDRTVLVSHKAVSATADGNAGGDSPSLSADGRYVAFRSSSTDLVPGQTGSETFRQDVFVFDRDSGSTVLASHAVGSPVTAVGGDRPVISADGGDVVFTSYAGNLVAGQTGESDNNVFEFHRATGAVTLVSHTLASPTQTSRSALAYVVNQDGGWVAFSSEATDLVPGQGSGDPTSYDVFLWERASGTVRVVSHSYDKPAQEVGSTSALNGISADGQHVLFESDARDLVGAVDPNLEVKNNLYLYDRSSGGSALVSYAGSGGDLGGNDDSLAGVLSADGGWMAFSSNATDLAPDKKDLNKSADLFLLGRATGERELVSRRDPGLPSLTPQAGSFAAGLSADGRYAVFVSGAVDLIPGVVDTNADQDVFLYDRVLKKTTLVSRSAASPTHAANAGSGFPSLSADGRYVLYQSDATDLVPGQIDDTPGGSANYSDLFLYDRVTGTTTLVSHSATSAVTATDEVQYALISADGSTIAFVSEARDLVPGQRNRRYPDDVFLYDRASGAVTLLSHSDGFPSTVGDDGSYLDALSADGRFVAVSSFADDLLAGVQLPEDLFEGALYLYDRTTGKPVLVSHAAGMPNQALGGAGGVLSADGRFLAFQTFYSGLVPGDSDPNGSSTLDVYLYDRVTGATRLVSHAQGSPTTATGASDEPLAISADGRFVAYAGGYAAPPPGSPYRNILLFDRISGQVELVSHGARGEEANGDCSRARVSADGRYVAFASQATNLTADPVTGNAFYSGRVSSNVYLYDRTAKRMTLVSRSFRPPYGGGNSGNAGGSPDADASELALSGSFVLFSSFSSNLVPGDFNLFSSDVFLYSPTP
jgi:Tol biopolymer transport system component